MNFELLERVWRSDANTPSEAASTYLMEEMMQTLRKRRKDFRGLIVLVGLMLTVQTGMIMHALLVQRVVDPAREWGVFLLVALAWLSLMAVARQFRRHLASFPDPEASMPGALRALIDENRTSRQRMKFLAIAAALFVAGMAVLLLQLHSVGKMTPGNIRDFTIVFGGGLLIGTAHAVWRYHRTLKPEGERLERLLADYG